MGPPVERLVFQTLFWRVVSPIKDTGWFQVCILKHQKQTCKSEIWHSWCPGGFAYSQPSGSPLIGMTIARGSFRYTQPSETKLIGKSPHIYNIYIWVANPSIQSILNFVPKHPIVITKDQRHWTTDSLNLKFESNIITSWEPKGTPPMPTPQEIRPY